MATAEELPDPPVSTRQRARAHQASAPKGMPPEPEIRKTEGSRYLPAALAPIGCFSHPSYFLEVLHGNG